MRNAPEPIVAYPPGWFPELKRQPNTPARREDVIAGAITAGKIPEWRAEHYRFLWNRDPAGTEALIAQLASVVMPAAGPSAPTPGRAAGSLSYAQPTPTPSSVAPGYPGYDEVQREVSARLTKQKELGVVFCED